MSLAGCWAQASNLWAGNLAAVRFGLRGAFFVLILFLLSILFYLRKKHLGKKRWLIENDEGTNVERVRTNIWVDEKKKKRSIKIKRDDDFCLFGLDEIFWMKFGFLFVCLVFLIHSKKEEKRREEKEHKDKEENRKKAHSY